MRYICALTIAGSDCSGGAGIQADIKTMSALGVYAATAITSITVQNTKGVQAVHGVNPLIVANQIKAVMDDIKADAVKIGMVSSTALIEVIAEKLKFYGAKNVVVDPVMVATSGARLIEDGALDALKRKLLPLATVITPNIPEAEILTESSIKDALGMGQAARSLSEKCGCSTLVKGGHSINDANDVLFTIGTSKEIWFQGKRISNPNTHGTGCTLSSAIAANLAKGMELEEAIENAKAYLSAALAAMLDLGRGSGPLAHNYKIL